MKIAITAENKQLDSPVEMRFGRCAYFILADPDAGTFEPVENPGNSAAGGAGVNAAQFLLDQKVNVLITGQVGPNAMPILAQGNVEVFRSEQCSIKVAVQRYKENTLERLNTATASAHAGLR